MSNRFVSPFLQVLFGCMVVLLVPTVVCAQDSTPTTPSAQAWVGARIIDGTGSPWYSGDIGVRDGKSVAIAGGGIQTDGNLTRASGRNYITEGTATNNFISTEVNVHYKFIGRRRTAS